MSDRTLLIHAGTVCDWTHPRTGTRFTVLEHDGATIAPPSPPPPMQAAAQADRNFLRSAAPGVPAPSAPFSSHCNQSHLWIG